MMTTCDTCDEAIAYYGGLCRPCLVAFFKGRAGLHKLKFDTRRAIFLAAAELEGLKPITSEVYEPLKGIEQ